MGPPRTRRYIEPVSRSRFHEGSMNDRVSAVPPVQFLGPEELAALERSPEMEQRQESQRLPPPPSQQLQLQLHLQQQRESGNNGSKKGGNILGQVWEGVRGRLRLRRDPAPVEERKKPEQQQQQQQQHQQQQQQQQKLKPELERPTREEALASYHQLVASGFFSSHAIQSTRQPPPPRYGSRPPTPGNQSQSFGPQWPLTPPAATTPRTPRVTRDIVSPTSVDSRGTKRAADDDLDDIQIHQDEEDESNTPKKLRKMSSRDFSVPSLRSDRSRRKLSVDRRISSTSNLPPVIVHHPQPAAHREPNKLTKRPPPPPSSLSTSTALLSEANTPLTSVDVPSPWTAGQNTRRNISEPYYSVRAVGAGSMSSRVLRPRPSKTLLEPLSVVPDANRGIPSVPVIPVKFTFGEDRENGQPWRGLRR